MTRKRHEHDFRRDNSPVEDAEGISEEVLDAPEAALGAEPPRVGKAEKVRLPRVAKEAVDSGVSLRGRRGDKVRRVRPEVAGEESSLFPRGGSAFARWCAREKGINPRERMPVDQYDSLLREFASRPIHGHRRGPGGGNHKPNRQHLR